jgi:exonuclease SbcC
LLLKEKLNSIDGIVAKEVETIEEQTQDAIKEMQERTKKALEYIEKNKKVDVAELEEKAKHIEKMKSYLRDAEKAVSITGEILHLKNKADEFTRKIEIARKLPGELLQKAKMPVEGITLMDGELLIDGLPLDNLSEGRQMEIALEVAKAKAGELKVVLVDGFEKLCKDRQDKFIEKAKQTGLQFFLTRVADIEGLNIIEL